jgi:hypothetical protein
MCARAFLNLFKGPAGVEPDVQSRVFSSLRDFDYGFGLQQRVAAGKGEAVQVFGLQNFLNYVRHVPLGSAHGVVRLRILAARTVVGAALEEQHVPHPGSIYGRMLLAA